MSSIFKGQATPLKMELIGCPETNNLFCVTSQTSEDLKNFLEFTDLKCSQTAVSRAFLYRVHTFVHCYCLLVYPLIGPTQRLCCKDDQINMNQAGNVAHMDAKKRNKCM